MLPFLLFAIAIAPFHPAAPASTPPLTLLKTIPLPHVRGRIDHMAFDDPSGRLFIAALGNDSLEVVDLAKGERIHSIPDLPEPQGVAVADRKGIVRSVIVSCGGDGRAHLFSLDTLQPLQTLKLAPDADNARLAGAEVYIGCGSDSSAAIARFCLDNVNTINSSIVRWPLKAHPEGLAILMSSTPPNKSGAAVQQPDFYESRLLVNVPSAHEVSAIDLNTGATAHWPIATAAANFPIAAWQGWSPDHTHSTDRAVIGCRQPPTLLLLDAADGHQLASAPCAHDVDDLILSPNHTRLYAICGGDGGAIDAFSLTTNSLSPIGRIATIPGARTGLGLATAAGFAIAVACPEHADHPAEIRIYESSPDPPPKP